MGMCCEKDDGLPLPSYDWAIEPQGLGPNVMTARTLFSDTQTLLVARVLNNSMQDKTLSANSFLSVETRLIYRMESKKWICSKTVNTQESVVPIQERGGLW